MLSKLLIGFLLLVGLFAGFWFWRSTQSTENYPEKAFVYEDFIQRYQDFKIEAELTNQEKHRELGVLLESKLNDIDDPEDLAYARYITARAFVNAVRKDNTDVQSLEKTLGLAEQVLTTDNDVTFLKAYTVDLVDFLLYYNVSKEVKQAIIAHRFFQQFSMDTNGTIWALRKNLLRYGTNFHPLSNLKFKVALIQAQQLYFQDKELSNTNKEILKQAVLNGMREADWQLQRELSGNAPLKSQSYLVEPLYNKALAADYLYRATGESPIGTAEELYQHAIEQSKKEFPSLEPVIKQSYALFQLSKEGKTDN